MATLNKHKIYTYIQYREFTFRVEMAVYTNDTIKLEQFIKITCSIHVSPILRFT